KAVGHEQGRAGKAHPAPPEVRYGPGTDADPFASLRQPMPASRQPHRELGEVADFAVDRDRAAVLLGYDLVAYRQLHKACLSVVSPDKATANVDHGTRDWNDANLGSTSPSSYLKHVEDLYWTM